MLLWTVSVHFCQNEWVNINYIGDISTINHHLSSPDCVSPSLYHLSSHLQGSPHNSFTFQSSVSSCGEY